MLKFANGDNLYFTSDIHGLHKNICYGTSIWDDKENNCRKFDNPNQMTDHIIDNINKEVKPDDHLFDLGDLLFHYKDVDSYRRFLNRFTCNNIYLLYGNHAHRENLAEACYDLPKIKFIGDYLEIQVGGKLICMSHYPFTYWNDAHRESWNLFGHIHGKYVSEKKQLDVGIDSAFMVYGEYRPFSYNEIKTIMNTKQTIKHHG